MPVKIIVDMDQGPGQSMEENKDLKRAYALLRDAYRYLTLSHPDPQSEEADAWRRTVIQHIHNFSYSRDPEFKEFADKLAKRE